MRDSGISILITDHQVRETLQITDRSYVIRGGKVLCHGDRNEVLRNPEARKYYFGEGMDMEINPVRPPHQPPVKEPARVIVEETKRKESQQVGIGFCRVASVNRYRAVPAG